MHAPVLTVSPQAADSWRPRSVPARKRGLTDKGYGHAGMADHMIRWLAQAAQEARLEAGRLEVHVAAALNRDQSTINRFEQGKAWPRNPDETIQAYADDLGVDPRQIWTRAIELWISAEKPSADHAAEAVRAASSAAQDRKRSTRRSAGKRPSTAKRRAAG
jgi:hypothetical protein